jgi:hypothetical protein
MSWAKLRSEVLATPMRKSAPKNNAVSLCAAIVYCPRLTAAKRQNADARQTSALLSDRIDEKLKSGF